MNRTMGLIADSELTEIELLIQKSRLDRHTEQVNSGVGRLKVCVKTRPAFEPPPGLIVTDGFLQIFAEGVCILKPFSYRCMVWMRENLASYETPEGFRFESKEELGQTSAGNFSYKLTDSEGYPCD